MEIHIPKSEVSMSFSRSGGKGGQNVNKVNTKVLLEFNVFASKTLTDEQKKIVSQRSTYRTGNGGHLILQCDETRSQARNREIALTRLNDHLSELLTPEEERIPTKPTKASKVKRVLEKQLRSKKKEHRRVRYDY